MKIQEALVDALDKENVEEVESLLKEVGESKYKEAVPVLIRYLKNTKNHRICTSTQ